LVFNDALLSMEQKFSPDLILIACNTLSVVYPFTNFAHVSKTPVLGIVEFGIEMILSEMNKNKNSEVLILGTETTINSETHKNKLIEKGIKADKIITQAFPGLESEIQDSPESETVKGMIELYISEAAEKLNDNNSPIIATLCCTHYGFCSGVFYSSLKNITNREIILRNPNELMIGAIVSEKNRGRFQETKLNVNVVSRAIIDDSEKNSIGGLISNYAPLSSTALMNYEYNPVLFKFQKE
jgi:glutamate racemase